VAKLTLQDRRIVIARLVDNAPPVRLLQAVLPDPTFSPKLATLGLPARGGDGVAVLATKAAQSGVTGANDTTLLYAANGVTFTEVAREEAGAGKFSLFSDPVTNDQGTLLFVGTARSVGLGLPSKAGLWRSEGGAAPEILAQIGTAATGPTGLPLTDTTWKSFTSFALPDGVGAGAVFVAQVAGKGMPAAKKTGLWAVDSGNHPRLLLRTGTDVTLPDGAKQLTSFSLLTALPGSLGARRSYNGTGAVAVLATFVDHSQALLRVDVP